MLKTLAVIAALGMGLGDEPHPYEEWLDYIEEPTMAPRLPVFASGDVTYSGGDPVYDSGDDLTAGSSSSNFCGDISVAEFILAASGVRLGIWTDSQGSGVSRMLQGVASTWDYNWSAWPVMPVSTETGQAQAQGGASSMQSSQWTDNTTTWTDNALLAGAGSQTIAQTLALEGIGAPRELPGRFNFFAHDNPAPSTYISGYGLRDTDESDGVWWFDADDWNPSAGVELEFTLCVLADGNTTRPTSHRFDVQHYNSGGSLVTTSGTGGDDLISDTLSSQRATLPDASNNSAQLVFIKSPTFTSYPSSAGNRPQALLRSWGTPDYDHAREIGFQGVVRKTNGKGGYEDGIGIYMMNDAASMNPATWIHDAELDGLSDRETYGSVWDVRRIKNANLGDPNVLVFSFGHNSAVRDYSDADATKAESAFQADLFDLVWQSVNDYNQQHASYPRVVIHIPWYGGSMDNTRHDEMVGVVNALNSLGVKTLGVDSYNYWGGDGFTNVTVTDYETATGFTIDGTVGTNVHPDQLGGGSASTTLQKNAQAAWFGFRKMLVEASESSTNRSRDRSRER